MIIKCLKHPEHDKFLATAHVTENWIVASDGEFLEVEINYEGNITHQPDVDDVYQCAICGGGATATND